jgi:hypothetical protein
MPKNRKSRKVKIKEIPSKIKSIKQIFKSNPKSSSGLESEVAKSEIQDFTETISSKNSPALRFSQNQDSPRRENPSTQSSETPSPTRSQGDFYLGNKLLEEIDSKYSTPRTNISPSLKSVDTSQLRFSQEDLFFRNPDIEQRQATRKDRETKYDKIDTLKTETRRRYPWEA